MKHYGVAKFRSAVVLNRLEEIRNVQHKIERLSGSQVTQTAMVSQIHLYKILLRQISSIHSNLAVSLEQTRRSA